MMVETTPDVTAVATPANGGPAAAAPAATASVLCPSCGQENTADSRFCRHCGVALAAGIAPVATSNGATRNGVAHPEMANGAAAAATADSAVVDSVALDGAASPDADAEAHSVSEEIDHRRAQQLVERAFALAERGDKAAAIVACRQAVSLDHQAVSAYSILGLLLEQAGDIPNAIHAYEKVMELAPDSLLEKESLERLRRTQASNHSGDVFHFNEDELYATDAPAGSEAATAVAVAAAATAGAASAAGTPAAVTAPVGARTVPAPPRSAVVDFGMTDPRGPVWLEALKRQPSYYFRGAPLAATTALSLLFLLWAHNWAVSQDIRHATQTTEASVTQPEGTSAVNPGVGGTAPNARPATGSVTSNSASTNANDPGFVANGSAPAGVNGATGTQPATGGTTAGAPVTNGNSVAGAAGTTRAATGTTAARTAPTPKFPPVAPRPSGDENATQDAQQLMGSLPPARPQTDTGPRRDAVSVLPATSPDNTENTNSRVISSGGTMVDPAGSGRGYVRVSPLRVSPSGAPVRSTTRANDAARAAAGAGRAGNTDRAVQLITPTMDSGDPAWNYQQRALLFLERGDYARARDDFGTAIAAYRDQINKGDNVAAATKALRACEEGRQEAIARMSR